MSAQNIEIAKLALQGLSARERQALLRELTGQPAPVEPDRLLRPRVAALRLGCTPRTIFNLLKTGALHRVVLPGRKRALGVRESEISALVAGGTNEP